MFLKKLRNASFILGLFFQTISFAKVETILGSLPLNQNLNAFSLFPQTEESEIIISREQYIISYNKNKRVSNWVMWKVDQSNLGTVPRTNFFSMDTELDQYLTKSNLRAVDFTDYRGSCFDRGHQIPSADRTNSASDNEKTFLMSNMIPQTPYLNRVIWAHLEMYTRKVVREQNKKAYVIAGSIFSEDYGKIGPSKDITIPNKNYKLIYFVDANQDFSAVNVRNPSVAVIMPNALKDGMKPVLNGDCKPFDLGVPAENNAENTTPTSKATIAINYDDWMPFKTTIEDVEKEAKISL